MSDNPTVCCILLTKDRPEMAARAVKCFREQTYENKRLLVLDAGGFSHEMEDDISCWHTIRREASIGDLRNTAIRYACMNEVWDPQIIAHWDDDDISHPNRLAEQVALLQASGADLVGYNECLFWDTRSGGSAWLYRYPNPAYALGSSFLYWRKTWERQPFDDVNHGEDERFRLKVKSVGISSLGSCDCHEPPKGHIPRMICAIHGGNTSHYAPERDRAMWRRAENWDATCERMMKL